jgi:hypothetical protein
MARPRPTHRFSETDFNNLAAVWKSLHPDDGEEVGGRAGTRRPAASRRSSPRARSTSRRDPGELAEIAKKLMDAK